MSQATIEKEHSAVAPDEVIRRIVDFCRASYDRDLRALVVYHPEHHPCPWSDCDTRIAAIEFHLKEQEGDENDYQHRRAAWWLGDGLIGPCPGCSQPVLFNVQFKATANFPIPQTAASLPGAWHTVARISTAAIP